MSKVTVYYYLTGAGKAPVKEFIEDLGFNARKKFFFVKALLEEFGHMLPRPHAAYLGGSIFELRFKCCEGAVRVLYFFYHDDKAVLTNAIIKKTGRVPKSDILTAIVRRKEFLLRQKGAEL